MDHNNPPKTVSGAHPGGTADATVNKLPTALSTYFWSFCSDCEEESDAGRQPGVCSGQKNTWNRNQNRSLVFW